MPTKLELIRQIEFGRRVAEDEGDELSKYFVETDQWRRIYAGDIDVIYGPKGSGKSAIYSLLLNKKSELAQRRILVIAGENPRGTPVFKDLVEDPPASEREFIGLWKLYFLSLLGSILQEQDITDESARKVISELEKADLLKRSRTLRSLLVSIMDYLRNSIPAIDSLGAGIELNENTGIPSGVVGKITLREPSRASQRLGFISVDTLIGQANEALMRAGFYVWILLDRLDVAFAETEELEENALRALFKVYLDLLQLSNIYLKIFLRTDIWRKLSAKGFREASHITRHTTIQWDERSLLNLIVRRMTQNEALCSYYEKNSADLLDSIEAQEKFFYEIFPDQVDVGRNNPATFRWMVGRVRDGSSYSAPRELIHFFNSVKEVQIRRLERGEPEPDEKRLFVRTVMREALPAVSKVRLEQTIYAEYPSMRNFIEKLRNERTSQSIETLSSIWQTSSSTTRQIAEELVEIGIFEQRGERTQPQYWVPFLYRDGLDMIQGTAE